MESYISKWGGEWVSEVSEWEGEWVVRVSAWACEGEREVSEAEWVSKWEWVSVSLNLIIMI